MQHKIKVENPQALAIAREIKALYDDLAANERKVTQGLIEYGENIEKQINENLERLRMAMCLPQMLNAKIELHNLDLGICVIHHGIAEPNEFDQALAMFEKTATKATEH